MAKWNTPDGMSALYRCLAALPLLFLGGCELACLPATTPPPVAPPSESEPADPPATDPCRGYTFAGSCDDDVLAYCSYGELVTVDCATVADEVAFTCAEIHSSYGYDCAAPPGAPCLDEVHGPAFCAGQQGACVKSAEGARCEEGYEACTPLDERRCQGDQLIVECNVVQPHVLDCPSFGTTCEGGACSGVVEGEACDPALLRCADGLRCDDGVCSAIPPAPDGGASLDGGVGEHLDAGDGGLAD